MGRVSVHLLVAAGLAATGIAAFIVALSYDMGTARRMGPGYFPLVLSGLLTVLALAEGVATWLRRPPGTEIDWRPLVAILGAILGFALTIGPFGLIPAFVVVVLATSLAQPSYGLRPALALAAGICLGAWLLFAKVLGMALPMIRFPL
jgi:hypothetical protein